jgi:hypothetical protein
MNKKIKDNGDLMRDGQNEGESKRNGGLLYLLKEKTIMGGRKRWVKSQHPVFSLSFGGFFLLHFFASTYFFYSFQLSFLFSLMSGVFPALISENINFTRRKE